VIRRTLVAGFGVTGRSVARSLMAAGDAVTAVDDRPSPAAEDAARGLGLTLRTTPEGADLESMLATCDLLVTSPGLPAHHPIFRAAAERDVPVWSEVELAGELARTAGGPAIAAITGTNGKTTVTTMATAILDASGIKSVAAGNIGLPLVDAVSMDVDVVVAEVSSFQLQFIHRFHPAVSCWLNFADDHLDWHPTVAHYRAAKASIWANQGPGDTAVINADDQMVVASSSSIPAGVRVTTFSSTGPADYMLEAARLVRADGVALVDLTDLPRAFPHDISDALAAAAVAVAAGASPTGCRDGLAAWQPLPHRVSFVVESEGVAWYDDSKATTPASVLAAVAAFPSVVLIAGGRNKGLDLSVLARTVPPVRAVVAIGEAAPDIERTFGTLVAVRAVSSMADAVDEAGRLAAPGDTVLLSPGCASFDWYRSYTERGDDFVRIVNEIVGKRGNRADN
jgi:UDP-N-acetylmuramoylalanine--D-glutamate ligase